MAGIPQNFQAISNVLPTYNFVDIISGTGYINFYAGKTVDLYLLSNFAYYSDTIYTSASAGTGSASKIIDIDFDVICNRTLNLSGTGIISIPLQLIGASTPGGETYIIGKLRKYSNSTETDIASNQSSTYSNPASSTVYYNPTLDVTIPLTQFKIGDTIRVTIEVWSYRTSGTLSAAIGHDPKARTAGWDSTGAVSSQLSFQCPVRLNL